jgi:ketosteroid isomerase-like protein
MTKAQILERNAVADYELEFLRHENIRVRVYGDCAVALARTVLKGRSKGQEFGGEYPYLRVWVKRNDRWQAVATQSTSVPR